MTAAATECNTKPPLNNPLERSPATNQLKTTTAIRAATKTFTKVECCTRTRAIRSDTPTRQISTPARMEKARVSVPMYTRVGLFGSKRIAMAVAEATSVVATTAIIIQR